MSVRVILGFLFFVVITFAAPGDSSLFGNFSSSTYPQWPDGWFRFSFEIATTNFWAQSNQQPRSSPYCIKCEGSSAVRNHDWIITRMVYPTLGDTIFSFWYEAHNRSVYESLEVWVSTTTPDTNGMTNRLDAFNFNNNAYLERIVNLSAYLNTPIYIGIYYPPFNRLGARIDDVTGPHYPGLDVAPIAISTPSSNFLAPGSFTPSAIIKNYGSTSPASFSVVCTLYNNFGIPIYSDAQNVLPFLPNTTTLVNFNTTPILTRGEYNLVVRTLLIGDCQIINDRKVRTIAVIQGTENFYDNGVVTQAIYSDLAGDGYGVKFTPTSYPRIIQGAEVMLSHEVYPAQPANNIFRIRLIDDDGLQGAPGTILWESNDIYGNRGDWNYIPTNEIAVNSGSYYLFWIQGGNYTQCAGIGADGALNAPNGTQWRYSGGTYSQNGLPNGDLMIRSVESDLISDAGVTAIIAPLSSVDSGQIIIPQARVKNFGNVSLNNIPIRFKISSWQDDTIIASLAPNESTIVSFADWPAAPRGILCVQCSTGLAGDINSLNDSKIDSVFVRVLDAQTITILQPTGIINQGDTVTPQAVIINNGNTITTFPVRFEISDGYLDDTTITLEAGTQTLVDFALWTANTSGSFTTKCSTQLNGDMYQTNDKATGSVFVQYLDVQSIGIISPTGNFYLGDTATPRVTIRNNGNTFQTFPVKFTIDDGYSDTKTVNNLTPGDTISVSFNQWTANTAGTFETKCSTQLSGDMNLANDKQSSSVFVGFIDVGTTTILSPPASVDSEQVISPQAIVKNFGNVALTNIPVRFTIDSWQSDTVINSLNPNESILVSFAPWTANQRGTFALKCSTLLAGDMNTINDAQTGSVFVRVFDVQVTSILQPSGTFTQNDTITPQATIRNNGNTSVTLPVLFEITDGYSDTVMLNLNPATQITADFSLWTANTLDSFETKCTTQLTEDMNPANDKQTGSVFVGFIDVGVISIITPSVMVDSGQTILPQAIVKNFGSLTANNIPVRFTIGAWQADTIIPSLAPNESITASFAPWTASQRGTFVLKCSTCLFNDNNSANDQQIGSVFIRVLDVQTISINQPAGVVNQGDTLRPRATIQNNGNTTVTFPVRFEISDGYSDDTAATLNPSTQTTLDFALWTATTPGSFITKCSTQLTNDMYQTNDKQTGSVFVGFIDIGTTAILSPPAFVDSGQTFTPQARIKNFGNITLSNIPVRFKIGSWQDDTIVPSLNPNESTIVSFATWIAAPIGPVMAKCSTMMADDMNKTNDRQTGLIFVRLPDVQTISIIQPTGTINQGDTMTPKAIVRNNGNVIITTPVRFEISDGYSNITTVTVNQGGQKTVDFALWTANTLGNFTTKCTTRLVGDVYQTNDKITGSLFVQYLDVQTLTIISPTGNFYPGDTATPQATVRNNGNTIQTFQVGYSISDGYSDVKTVNNLAPGNITAVNFNLWTANTSGSFETKCSTQLAGDKNPANDKLTGSVFVGFTDVGVTAILAPPTIADSGQTITPQARIKNFGSIVANNIPVRFTIDNWQDDTIITSLAPNESTIVSFADWTATQRGSLAVKCSTRLAGDFNSSNDKQISSVLVRVFDVQTVSIVRPTGSVNLGDTVTPQATLRNIGNTSVAFPVRFGITDEYLDEIITTINPDSQITVSFALWTANTAGNFVARCSTKLTNDMNPANDLQTASVFVGFSDVGTITIIAPPALVDSGQTVTPQASIKNFSNTTANYIPVRFTINGWQDNKIVLSLAPNESTTVTFAAWTATQRGNLAMKCSTLLSGDINPFNDQQTGTLFVRVLDVQTISIINPPAAETLNQGDTVTPQAIVKNNGNTSVTFPVRFEIFQQLDYRLKDYRLEKLSNLSIFKSANLPIPMGKLSNYSDDTILTLGPGVQTTVNFALWIADTVGNFITQCSTQLAEDMNPANDKQTGSVLVGFIDVGVTAITAPGSFVDSGQTITPQARIKNFGNLTANNIPVRFNIGAWQADTIVSILAPNESTTVTFAPWTASQRGDFEVKCSTRLACDFNMTNDKQTSSVFVAVLDIATIAILAPPTSVDSGQIINPLAKVKNLGNVVLGYIPIRFTVGTWQHDTLIPNLNPGESTFVGFAEWNVLRRGNWVMKCSTRFNTDMNKRNDKLQDSIFVRVLDVAASNIIMPTDSVIKDSTFTPKAKAKNYGNTRVNINCYFAIIRTPDTLYQKTTNLTINPNQELEVIFPDTLLDSTGIYTAGFWTELAEDMHPENNLIEDNFRVYVPIPPLYRVWIRMADIPVSPSDKSPKSGSCMAGLNATGKIYYLKASNTQDFCIYTPDTSQFALGNWTSDTMPIGSKETFDGKKPKKGTSIAAYEPGKCVYVLRGSNSQGFWKYQADTLNTMLIGWKKMKEIPLGTKAPKDGSGIVAVDKAGTDYIFTMKGSRTSEFYLYDIANNTWKGLSSPPIGASGKKGYKKGSCLTYDENGFTYVLKGNYGDFFKYSIEGDSWYELRRYDAKVFRNRDGKKKKIKDGSAIAYHDNNIYLLKGSNTYEFWMYSIAGDTWIQLDAYWDIPTGIGKKVKGGGALIKFGNHFYATKGNKTSEFYRHLLPTKTITLASNTPLSDGTMANKLTNNEFNLMISPNPATNHAMVKYNLMKKGTVTLKLYNICGELVKSYSNPHPTQDGMIQINTKDLAAGIYILRFNSSEVNGTRKLVIER